MISLSLRLFLLLPLLAFSMISCYWGLKRAKDILHALNVIRVVNLHIAIKVKLLTIIG
jgi:hypothetical protein